MSRTLMVYNENKKYVEKYNDYGYARYECEFIEFVLRNNNINDSYYDNTMDDYISYWFKLSSSDIDLLLTKFLSMTVKEIFLHSLGNAVEFVKFIDFLQYLAKFKIGYYIGFI